MGEYENGEHWALEGFRKRKDHPLMPLTMLACPDEGHFASTDNKAAFLGFYIEKAAHYRLPARYPDQGPVVLRPLNPETSGWLVPAWKKNSAPGVQPAPVGAYKGIPTARSGVLMKRQPG